MNIDKYVDPLKSGNMQYLPTKVINITGIAPENLKDNYATIAVFDENNKIIYLDEKQINDDRSYNFKFETKADISKCRVIVRSGVVAFTENIFITSDKRDVIKPKLIIDKDNVKLTMTFKNNFDITDYDYNLIFALYGENNKLIAINQTGEKKASFGDNSDDVSIIIDAEKLKDIKTMKGFVWDKNLSPLIDIEFINYQ